MQDTEGSEFSPTFSSMESAFLDHSLKPRTPTTSICYPCIASQMRTLIYLPAYWLSPLECELRYSPALRIILEHNRYSINTCLMNKYIQILPSGTNTLEYALAMPSINGHMPTLPPSNFTPSHAPMLVSSSSFPISLLSFLHGNRISSWSYDCLE